MAAKHPRVKPAPLPPGPCPAVASAGDDPLRQAGALGLVIYLAIGLTVAAFTLLLAISPWRYHLVLFEDGPVENLTAVAFLLAGLGLFTAAWRLRVGFGRLPFALLGVVMVVIAGEEISWGQRILGFATPDALSRNSQGEANLHNMPAVSRFTLRASIAFMLLPCIFGAAGALGRRERLFGVPLPSLPLALGGLVALAWRGEGRLYGRDADFGFWLGYAFDGPNVPFLMLGVYALVARRFGWLLAVAAAQALCAAFGYVDQHVAKSQRHPSAELRELLFGLFWLGYAAQLLACWRDASGRLGRALTHRRAWPVATAGLLALGAGLMAFEALVARAARTDHGHAMLAEARRLVTPATPAAGEAFDVALHSDSVAYFKHPCKPAEIRAGRFFLHIYPKDPADLPLDRSRPVRFATLDFPFDWHGAHLDGACGAVVPLPDYPITSLRTGQWNRERLLWEAWQP